MLKYDAGTVLIRENHQTRRVRGPFMDLKMVFVLDCQEGVLVSQGCRIRLPQPWWLKTTEMYPLTVLEVRGPKGRCEQGQPTCRSSRGEPLPPFCWLPLAPVSSPQSPPTWPRCRVLFCPSPNPWLPLIRIYAIVVGLSHGQSRINSSSPGPEFNYIFGH